MALTMLLKEGADLFIGDEKFVVEAVYSETEFVLSHKTPGKKGSVTVNRVRRWHIDGTQAQEVLPDVFVSAGRAHPSNMARPVIDAPRDILILRGELYRKGERKAG